jgi:hypothetical protein
MNTEKGLETNVQSTEKIKIENHLSEKVMEIVFPEGFKIASDADLQLLKSAWTFHLKRWHSPYTCLFDVRNFEVVAEKKADFEKLIKFFKNFFMRKIVGFGEEGVLREDLPFEVIGVYEEAIKKTGLSRGGGLTRDLTDFRSRIQVDNDFNAHVMEVSFLAETIFESADDVKILKSKLQNILMLWHTPYSVLFDCSRMKIEAPAKEEFARLEKFLKSFFCKGMVGYGPRLEKDSYPFPTYRARHLAAAQLEHSGLNAGDMANCSTRNKTSGNEG